MVCWASERVANWREPGKIHRKVKGCGWGKLSGVDSNGSGSKRYQGIVRITVVSNLYVRTESWIIILLRRRKCDNEDCNWCSPSHVDNDRSLMNEIVRIKGLRTNCWKECGQTVKFHTSLFARDWWNRQWNASRWPAIYIQLLHQRTI